MPSSTLLVTGCSRGLCLEFVRQLIARGDRVIATCRAPDEAPELSALVTASPSSHMLPLDMADEASIAKLPAQLEAISIDRIDVLLHNAGVSAPTHPVDPFATATGAALRHCFEVNAVGPLLLTQTLLPHLRQGASKKVLFVSSIMGSIEKTVSGGSVSYRTSKAAVNMVGKCLAGEHGLGTADNLLITLCHPGWCETDMGSAGNRSPPVKPEVSVGGMLAVLDAMAAPHAKADFLDYTGKALEW
jgi:NAD(P)-dependent dehydrogenase (short-subunit alcohol dehydrogenase family)